VLAKVVFYSEEEKVFVFETLIVSDKGIQFSVGGFGYGIGMACHKVV